MLIRFIIVSLSLFFFLLSWSLFLWFLPAFFLTCQFYVGGIPMSTTFPFYRAKQSQSKLFLLTNIIHSIINNSLLLLLQLSIHTITIIHPHLIGISPLHCHYISIPLFRLPHLNTISTLGVFFFAISHLQP